MHLKQPRSLSASLPHADIPLAGGGNIGIHPNRFRLAPTGAAVGLVLLALAAVTLMAVVIDIRTGVSVATVGWLYLLVILPVTLRWGRVAGLTTAGAALVLLLTFETEPRGFPYTHSGVDIIRIAVSMGVAAIAVLLVDRGNHGLPRRERTLAALVAASGGAIAGHDLGGVIVSWNAGAERLYRYAPEEAIGR